MAFGSPENRLKYNGKEEQRKEFNDGGGLECLDYDARYFDFQIGRFNSPDPLNFNFPYETGYGYVNNNPILFTDKQGLYKYPKNKASEYSKNYPTLTAYLTKNIANDVMSSPIIIAGLIKYAGHYRDDISRKNLDEEKIKNIVTWGNGPNIEIVKNPGGHPFSMGWYADATKTLQISTKVAKKLEKASDEERTAILLGLYITILHETVHYGDYLDNVGNDGFDPGQLFAEETWGFGNFNDIEHATEVIEKLKKENKQELIPTDPKKKKNNTLKSFDEVLSDQRKERNSIFEDF